jgi:hypothetical protein
MFVELPEKSGDVAGSTGVRILDDSRHIGAAPVLGYCPEIRRDVADVSEWR